MAVQAPVRDIVTELRHWIVGRALPYWATSGVDWFRGGFHERIRLDGHPDIGADKRVRVQARQIYVFAHAAALGWFPDGLPVALRAFDFLMDRAHAPDGTGGFVQLLTPEGRISDPTRDTYDHAFILLALAWLARACNDSQVIEVLAATLDFVDERLALPDGTFRESWPERGGHRQNPHMHMFEAMLALHETLAWPGALERAQTICELLETHFIERESDTLCEHFGEAWQPAEGAAGRSREPGHAAEWTWLLRKHERLAAKPSGRRASMLLESAIRLACPDTGLLLDEVDRSGTVLRDTRRCWPQTELAKAWLAEAEIGRVGAAERARRVLVHLADEYVGRPLRGTWTDCFAADGAPACDHIPASTLYHLFCATAEMARVLGEPSPTRPAPTRMGRGLVLG